MVTYSRISKASITLSSVGSFTIIMIQLIRILSKIMRSKYWLLITRIQNLRNGFHGENINSDLVAVNRNIVNLENFFAIVTNDWKRKLQNNYVTCCSTYISNFVFKTVVMMRTTQSNLTFSVRDVALTADLLYFFLARMRSMVYLS